MRRRPATSLWNRSSPSALQFHLPWRVRWPLGFMMARMTTSSTDAPANATRRICKVYNITGGLVPYQNAWVWQQRLLRERMAWQREVPRTAGHDVLLLLEHPSVYTLGRGSSMDNIRFDARSSSCSHEVRRTERGGEVTWHGPGQIVGYPVLDLNYHKKDLHWYLRQLEEVIIQVLAKYGLQGEREREHTGVWVNGAKVAAIGLNASRWITTHGLSLNVVPDLTAFESIVPCGIHDRQVTRLCDIVPASGASPSNAGAEHMKRARADILSAFESVFHMGMDVRHLDAGTVDLDAELFPVACDRSLLDRLEDESRKQLELERRR